MEAQNFGDLDTTIMDEADVSTEMLAKKLELDKIYFNCYNTPEGKRMFEHMRERHVDTPMYKKGDSLELVAYRQGMCDLVTMMEACVDDALTVPQGATSK